MTSNHDIAVGMLEGCLSRVTDPECNAVAASSSASTAILIFRTLSVISAEEDARYTKRLRHLNEQRYQQLTRGPVA